MTPTDDKIYWSEAPEGCTHWLHTNWHRNTEGVWHYWDDNKNAWIRNSVQGSTVFNEAIPRPTAWQGEGLPPEGTLCEGKLNWVADGWFNCTINAYKGDKVWFTDHTYSRDRDFVYPLNEVKFRPLRTKEEVEREKIIDEIVDDCNGMLDHEQACWVYDQGYRKPMNREKILERFRTFCPGIPESSKEIILDALGF